MVTVEISKRALTDALESAVSSLKRSAGKASNPLIAEIIEKDIRMYQQALLSITEIN